MVSLSILPATWCYEMIFAGADRRGSLRGSRMFKARLKPSDQGTLERRYEFHVAEAVHATLLGDHEKAAGHSARALKISRQLYASARDPAQHRPDLAAALAGHARHEEVLESVALLTESAGHYAALAAADPPRYEVDRIDVLVRIAL